MSTPAPPASPPDSHQHFAQLLASIDGIVWEADARTFRFTYVSEQAERLLGYPLREWFAPAFWQDHLHPDDRTWAVDYCARATREKRVHDFEYRMFAADGRVVWLRDIVTVVVEGGEPTTLRGIMVDVTEKKRVEEGRQEHVRFLESLDRVNRAIQGATDVDAMMRDVLDAVLAVLDCDRAWLVYPCDPQAATWQAVMERTRPEFPGAHLAGVELPVQPDVAELYRAVRAAGVPVCFGHGADLPLPGQAAAMFGIRSQLCVAVFPKVDLPYLFGIHQCSHPRVWSASDQRLFQEIGRRLSDSLTTLLVVRRLHASEARFRVLVDHASDAFFLHDLNANVLDVNRQACDCLGYTREELIGMHPTAFDAGLGADAIASLVARLGAGEMIAFETRHRRKDGTEFPVEVRTRPLWEGGKRYSVSLARDITARLRLEEEFRQAQKMEAVGRLAGGIAHDFNNLLTVINGYSELACKRLPAGDPTRGLVAEILKSGERAATLTRQLLAFSRKQVLLPQVVNVNALIDELAKLLRRLIGEDVELVLDSDPDLGVTKVDPGQFEQAVINLVVNARDAMPDGGRVTVATRNVDLPDTIPPSAADVPPGPYVVVTVSDTGQGMDEATQARIFEPFFTTKELGKGTGLGLAMVYGFVQQSGGHVEVGSGPGRGTTFRVFLPWAEAVTPTRRPAQHPLPIPTGSETILLVEDEQAVRDLSRTILESCGYAVLEARDGEQGVAVARQAGAIDLLVTDLVMPRMSGRRLADVLLAARPGLRVLFLSGYSEEAAFTQGSSTTGMAFLHKPFTVTSLARTVRDVLDRESP